MLARGLCVTKAFQLASGRVWKQQNN